MNDITITPTDDTEIQDLVLDSVEIAPIADTAKQADTEIEEIMELELAALPMLPTKPTKPKKTLAIEHDADAKNTTIPQTASSSNPLDHTDLSATVKQELEEVAERIRSRVKGSIIDTGADLIEVKGKLDHGRFREWLKRNFGWSPSTAENLMRAARAFEKTPKVVEFLPPTIVYRLAAKSIPEKFRADIVEEIVAGKIAREDVVYRLKKTEERRRTSVRKVAKQAPETPEEQKRREARERRAARELEKEQAKRAAERAKRATVAEELLVLMKSLDADYPRFRALMMQVDIHVLRDAIEADTNAATVPVAVADDVQREAA